MSIYKDPDSIREAGIMVTVPIPPECIEVSEEIPAQTFLIKNWLKAKNKKFYGRYATD